MNDNNEATITGYRPGLPSKISIPAYVEQYPVTVIGNGAFDNSTFTSIEIPSSVIKIGLYAFNKCSSLRSVTFGENSKLESIVSCSFWNCSSLTSIEIPSGVTSIGDMAFYYCSSLTSIEIPSSVTSIGDGAFFDCSSLTSITVDNANKKYSSDERGALFNKDKTTLIQYPAGNTSQSYEIPSSVTSIGDSAFYSCYNLTSIEIPSSVTSIGGSAFRDCSSLASIEIPSSVTSIGNHAFYDTGYYNNSSNWENDVLYIGNHLIKAETSISGAYAIKSGTKTIADSAFQWRESLTSIEIPSSVTSIGDMAFNDCISLSDVYYTGSEDEWNEISISTAGNTPLLNATIHYNYTPVKYGDISGDGAINISDAIFVAQSLASSDIVLTEAQRKAADVNCDGSLNISDAILLQQHLASPDITLGPGK